MALTDYLITGLSYLIRKNKRKLIKEAISFNHQTGIEIGGPSDLFKLKGQLPIYLFASRVDGVNFSSSTIWEGQLKEGEYYQYYVNKIGHQYIAEASELDFVSDDQYDFVLSCHSLEHVANPLKAIMGWKRIIKTGGKLALVLPDKEYTFDIKRPYTQFEHLLDDYQRNTPETDNTHFEEVIDLHDFTRDGFLQSKVDLEKRTMLNLENRAVHHHVFSLKLVAEMLEWAGFEIIWQQTAAPHHLITIARKKA
ncbi:MAG: hypothetical protein B7Y15_12990 [Bacteroidetes bacterium 24-39-8]|jgi:ubiquinone/menaquinone biosynthesis C-methylase UbiE|nr:MAG: hypothetical protein B7Y15_12990 [Bacteroidetes bacterium 24-39-8]HQR94557.1 methyltransferase domain-containing protein [Sediminibacterium sp.]HQS55721.1 methyltransferase domain-containing protein [Sediminibacterium sp.]